MTQGFKNSVLALRAQQISESRREFNARGGKMDRCEQCLIAKYYCICEGAEYASCDAAVCLLMYHNESFKPSNTGRLIAEIVPDNYAFRWDRTSPDPALLALLNNDKYQPFVIFPAEDVETDRVVTQVEPVAGKTPLFIFLDGTWREAKKMIRKSPYLDNLPVLSITAQKLSDYRLRVAPHAHQLGTAEVAIMVLALANEVDASTKLEQHFIKFRDAYLLGKRNKGRPE
ncbi:MULTISPECIES: DTW domain-containing protein [Pseudoalteromonas]|uniref:tRNA-uridine aminocarboxypropyltransferase n=1 Tax=Pseudoalteromonas TaxID=53246 RepID=UPI0005645B1A|nr:MULTISPECIES: DTW domain-containing protein [Pseudoalteromonas]MDN3406616.1 DTW domain-containing protein [Pseudoalteromonas sp. APC 3218]MDN3409585.1 DTW domain-containing protein [Pseudoalteromonas sp. APC 3894]MDN3416871.1 DTW domain-containing protein [Pseudoalteromonas sp. APC 3227]MDN3421676.1 DTW domain-containing protein [Pseudoalteromonas sp. APC 3895]MDN3424369.1 DTW domain-containing protein [Pseudoalteromonas sp. APC 3896]